MEKTGLRLITNDAERPGQAVSTRRVALWTGALVLLAAAVATLLGADRARRPVESKELAQQTIVKAIEAGSRDPEVRSALLALRRELARRPLDAYTRAIYASLLLGVSREPDHTRAAEFHAARASELAPVTVPVIRYAAHVLVRTGDIDRALELIREMFRYDPTAAARLLSEVEPLLPPDRLAGAIPDDPDAWIEWIARLRDADRPDLARAWLQRARARWPGHLVILDYLASTAMRERDWAELARLFPPDQILPKETAAARLFCYRARLRAEQGDSERARSDVETALGLQRDSVETLYHAGDVLESLGDVGAARRQWTRALHMLSSGSSSATRVNLLVRLAHLEDREGSPAAALRRWREVLGIDPDHAEARRRVDDLTGFRR